MSRLRSKVRKGTATKAERARLADWERGKQKPGRPAEPVEGVTRLTPAMGKPAEAAPSDVAPAESAPSSDAAQTSAADTQEIVKPASPPRILPSRGDGKASTTGDWRDKYRVQADGREATCLQVSELWLKGLRSLNDYISKSGRDPVISEESIATWLEPSIVLTVDMVLPAHLEISPPVMVAVGTTGVLVQAAVAKIRGPRVEPTEADKLPGPVGGPTYLDKDKPVQPKPEVSKDNGKPAEQKGDAPNYFKVG